MDGILLGIMATITITITWYYDYYYSGLNNYVIYSGYQNVSYGHRASNSTNVNQMQTHNKEVELIYTGAIKAY